MEKVEKPVVRTLYRQSSIETHLVPKPPPDVDLNCENKEYDNNENESSRPRIVDCIVKVVPPQDQQSSPSQSTQPAELPRSKPKPPRRSAELSRITSQSQAEKQQPTLQSQPTPAAVVLRPKSPSQLIEQQSPLPLELRSPSRPAPPTRTSSLLRPISSTQSEKQPEPSRPTPPSLPEWSEKLHQPVPSGATKSSPVAYLPQPTPSSQSVESPRPLSSLQLAKEQSSKSPSRDTLPPQWAPLPKSKDTTVSETTIQKYDRNNQSQAIETIHFLEGEKKAYVQNTNTVCESPKTDTEVLKNRKQAPKSTFGLVGNDTLITKVEHEEAKTQPVLGGENTSEEESELVTIYREKECRPTSSLNYLQVPGKEHRHSVGTMKIIGFKSANMASPRPKSPRPPVSGKNEKEETFWEKIGTLGRKKRIRKVQDVQDEGKYAIDSPGSPTAPDLPPEEYALEENEERSMIEPRSFEDPKLKELITVLIEWINDELADQRIIVKDIDEDLYDGQVLQKLIEKLSGDKLDVPEVTQSEEGQKQKLGIVLQAANRILGPQRWPNQKWSVESVHSKNIVAILHLLVTLARHFRAPVRLPENVTVGVVVVQKREGSLSHRTVTEEITSTYDDLGMRCERDAFDTLFDHAPDKLQVVKKSLVTFVNKQLNKVNLEVSDLDTQFHDGVYLTLLMGLLEGFFVPLFSFHLTPQTFEHKVHNVQFAFELMQDVGIPKPKARPEDIVNLDLKSTLRVLYNLFTKYKNLG